MEKKAKSGPKSQVGTSFSQEIFPAQRSTKKKSASKKPGPKPQKATKSKTSGPASTGKGVQKTPSPKKKTKPSGVTNLTFSQLEEQSDFSKPVIYELGTGFGDLDAQSAPINPIFSRSNFVSETLVWPVLEPSLRLASRFLESVQLRTTIALMWRARRAKRTIPGEKDNKGSQLELYPNAAIRRAMQDDSDASTLEIDAIMDELSQCIRFDEAKNATEAKARDGTNTQVRAEPLTSQEGNGGTVYYDTDMYLDLLKATRTPLKSSDVPNLLILRFQFAITLVHEVMHALQNRIYGELDTDPFHGGDQLAVGFKAECTLFDGQFDVLCSARSPRGRTMVRTSMLSEDIPSELVGIPLVWRWPCRTTMVRYTHYNLGISARKGWNEKLPQKDVAWRIRPADVDKYFTRAFWADADARSTKHGLFLPQKIGHAFKATGYKGHPVPTALDEGEEQQTNGQYVPDNCRYEPTGQDILRVENVPVAKGKKKSKAKPKAR